MKMQCSKHALLLLCSVFAILICLIRSCVGGPSLRSCAPFPFTDIGFRGTTEHTELPACRNLEESRTTPHILFLKSICNRYNGGSLTDGSDEPCRRPPHVQSAVVYERVQHVLRSPHTYNS